MVKQTKKTQYPLASCIECIQNKTSKWVDVLGIENLSFPMLHLTNSTSKRLKKQVNFKSKQKNNLENGWWIQLKVFKDPSTQNT
jgi:hypothetical protein